MPFIALFTALSLLTLPALAQDYSSLLGLPEGATVMSISTTERTEVKQDLLTATLRYQAENADPVALQDDINKIIGNALKESDKVKNVQVSTLGYNVYQYDPNRRKDKIAAAPIWRGEQSLQIKSTDSEALLDLAGKLQKIGLVMSQLGYSVSPDLRDATQNNLLELALEHLTAKATRAGKALGKNTAQLLKVDVGASPSSYPQQRMMQTMATDSISEMAAPVAAPGHSDITLDVSAIALLTP